ncbi:hypothetical protein [Nocardia amamiensis]|uniref:hypothetical protein n=1 Tax=Nocardia amamiensis TaxID=404578 RepID=UPI0008344C3A|nr:hypothetical protein [Nocardia amamiensis]
MGEIFARRLLLSVDAAGYGAADDQRQRTMQTAIRAVLDRAATEAGLDRSAWITQPGGDGELAILPADQSDREPTVVNDFVRELNYALAVHNRDLLDIARLRLRLAIHYGVANPADNGYAGQGVVAVSRLVDSSPAKAALREAPAAHLAVVLSQRVFTDVVAQGHTPLSPFAFREITVRNKEFAEPAYLLVPGHDVHALSLTDTGVASALTEPEHTRDEKPTRTQRQADTPGAPATANLTFHGNITAPHAVFGISAPNGIFEP